jgi:thiol-disulfide isomerase/thioredoxin
MNPPLHHWLGLALAGLLAWAALPVLAHPESADFVLDDLDGQAVGLSDFRGRWVVVSFWASWCEPCERELPELVRFQSANPDVQVIGINFEETTAEAARAFLEPFAVNFPNLRIGATPLIPFEPLEGLPTTVIVDPEGHIAARHMGPVGADYLQRLIEQYRAAAP